MGNYTNQITTSLELVHDSGHHSVVVDKQRFSPHLPRYVWLKYAVERLLAAILLLPVIPVIFLLSCIVRLNSKGAPIYKQTRVGLDGKEFSMYKIRTMVIDAEVASGPKWSTESDPRITTVGRIYRFLHLDELPQLFNVMRGDMSVVGPRPERPEFVSILERHIAGYNDRLFVKPGITGLAQIYLPPDQTLNCVRKKVKMDRAYIETVTPLVDLQIVLCTMLRIVGIRKGRGPRWLGLDRHYRDVVKECNRLDTDSRVISPRIDQLNDDAFQVNEFNNNEFENSELKNRELNRDPVVNVEIGSDGIRIDLAEPSPKPNLQPTEKRQPVLVTSSGTTHRTSKPTAPTNPR